LSFNSPFHIWSVSGSAASAGAVCSDERTSTA
jgi:hypothetical protein